MNASIRAVEDRVYITSHTEGQSYPNVTKASHSPNITLEQEGDQAIDKEGDITSILAVSHQEWSGHCEGE